MGVASCCSAVVRGTRVKRTAVRGRSASARCRAPPAHHSVSARAAADGARARAVGDVHGDIRKVIAALGIAGVLAEDEAQRPVWVGGDTVVVQLGDVLDRGDHEIGARAGSHRGQHTSWACARRASAAAAADRRPRTLTGCSCVVRRVGCRLARAQACCALCCLKTCAWWAWPSDKTWPGAALRGLLNGAAGSVLLLRELDRQARLQGGAVYMLNGNHESLNVCGDFRRGRPPASTEAPCFFLVLRAGA
jgi:hypothetical protein